MCGFSSVYSSFRKMHTKSIMKLQTFTPEGAKGRSSREGNWFGVHMCPTSQREHQFCTKTFQMLTTRGTRPILENEAFARHESWQSRGGKPHEEPGNTHAGAQMTDSLQTKLPQQMQIIIEFG